MHAKSLFLENSIPEEAFHSLKQRLSMRWENYLGGQRQKHFFNWYNAGVIFFPGLKIIKFYSAFPPILKRANSHYINKNIVILLLRFLFTTETPNLMVIHIIFTEEIS